MTALKSTSNARIVLVLQARMGSTRLPGKSLMPLAGMPLLGRILERVKRAERPHAIVVATTERSEDGPLVAIAEAAGVHVFRGSESDLVDRHYQAARAHGADIVVRLPADNAMPEPAEIDRIIETHLQSGAVFSTNLSPALGNRYPDGIGAEVMDFWALEEVWRKGAAPDRREHPHLNFFDYKTETPADAARYPVGTVPCPEAFARPDLVLDINTQAQYDFIKSAYDYIYPQNSHFHITDVIRWHDTIYRPLAKSGVS
jgi:spore coat polysaccharide biosynthesis protein SpsF